MVITATRIIKRAWQIYVAHVFLLVVYLVEIGYFGQKFGEAEHAASFNVKIFLDRPAEVLYEGLILKFKPVNMDVLPLFIVLMLASPLMLWEILVSKRHPACLGHSLSCGAAIRLEFFLVSGRKPVVLQSIRLAAAVRVRRLAGSGRSGGNHAVHPLASGSVL